MADVLTIRPQPFDKQAVFSSVRSDFGCQRQAGSAVPASAVCSMRELVSSLAKDFEGQFRKSFFDQNVVRILSRQHEDRNGIVREWLDERGNHSGRQAGSAVPASAVCSMRELVSSLAKDFEDQFRKSFFDQNVVRIVSRQHEDRNGIVREWLDERGNHSGLCKWNGTFQLKAYPLSFHIQVCRHIRCCTNYGQFIGGAGD